MGFRIRKKIKLLPGLSLNVSKSGASLTAKVGPVNWNSRTGKTSVNLPGPLSYQSNASTNRLKKAELVAIAKQNGLKGYSKLKKAELIELLRQHHLL